MKQTNCENCELCTEQLTKDYYKIYKCAVSGEKINNNTNCLYYKPTK